MNKIIGEGKRFLAYEIVKRLKSLCKTELLDQLINGVQINEQMKGKIHQVFRLSFDAKVLDSVVAVEKVLDYIYYNPVNGKWNLAEEYTGYPYSSACYYELGKSSLFQIYDYRKVDSVSFSSDTE